ncbi:hypothetical protein ATR1_452c0001 [Acetobacter tropicalis]|uniref:hypothetical protein n=1 Tax=Acetobacter tropicalis TaxID=104102 RepID=UPI0005B137B5|nr:hypothetical protein [Acetobacter tropicalis]KXV49640.1 hypothetical protein AD944_07410 [Acetobacter tropicalis]GAL99176.1 hypothetical protein ATR1_452c0001 [Acetobacter tropicalis]
MASRLGASTADLPAVLKGLGIRLKPAMPLEKQQFGPPVPVMLQPVRAVLSNQKSARQKKKRAITTPPPSGPFAVLAVLQKRR